MAETEIADRMFASDKYVTLRTAGNSPLPESKPTARWLARKEVAVCAFAVSFLYMMNGTYAGTMCNILTSVPVAFFTYKVLINKETNQAGYNAILFYWSIYGASTIFDALFQESYGYFMLKFVLLVCVFGHAAQKNERVFREIFGTEPAEVTDYVSMMWSAHHDEDGYPLNSPAPTGFSEDDESDSLNLDGSSIYMPSTAATACEIHYPLTDKHRMEQLMSSTPARPVRFDTCEQGSMSSTQPNSTIYSLANSKITPRLCHGIDRVLTPHLKADFNPATACQSAQTALPIPKRLLAARNDSSCTIGPAYGDIITNPIEKVVFTEPGEEREITVVNVRTENIMWALKCNALHRLGASPSSGVIPSGGQMKIRVMLHVDAHVDGSNDSAAGDENGDKLAIDYALVGDQKNYCVSFVRREDKKRHLLRIAYRL